MKSFFFKVRFVCYAFLYTDFGKITQKMLARTIFYTKWRIYVWKGLSLVVLLISKTDRR